MKALCLLPCSVYNQGVLEFLFIYKLRKRDIPKVSRFFIPVIRKFRTTTEKYLQKLSSLSIIEIDRKILAKAIFIVYHRDRTRIVIGSCVTFLEYVIPPCNKVLDVLFSEPQKSTNIAIEIELFFCSVMACEVPQCFTGHICLLSVTIFLISDSPFTFRSG